MGEKKIYAGTYLPRHRLAAPSWVISGTLSENCDFLATRVDEVGLLFMESEACLNYGPEALPPWLANLPLTFHVHLPVDLPMLEDPARAANICFALLRKTAFLAKGGGEGNGQNMPHLRAVLHPPGEDPARPGRASCQLDAFLRIFENMGGDPSLLMLENIEGNDLLRHLELVEIYSMSICLDLGHALAYGQKSLLENPALPELLGMLHLCAPGPGASPGKHMPLAALDQRGREKAAHLCALLPPGEVIMVELFDWSQIQDSLPLLLSWLSSPPPLSSPCF